YPPGQTERRGFFASREEKSSGHSSVEEKTTDYTENTDQATGGRGDCTGTGTLCRCQLSVGAGFASNPGRRSKILRDGHLPRPLGFRVPDADRHLNGQDPHFQW